MTYILRALRLVVLYIPCFTAVLMFRKEQFHLVHKAENPHLVWGEIRKVLLIEFYTDVRAFETKKTAKMPLTQQTLHQQSNIADRVADAIKAF